MAAPVPTLGNLQWPNIGLNTQEKKIIIGISYVALYCLGFNDISASMVVVPVAAALFKEECIEKWQDLCAQLRGLRHIALVGLT